MRKLLKGLVLVFVIFILIRISYDYKMVILNDDYITSYVDGTYSNSIPSKSDAVFDYAICDDGVNVLWNDNVWGLMISNLRQKTRCNLYFQTIKNVTRPELYQGFIPVTYDANGNVVISSEDDDWYDYENRKWANAVLVNCSDTKVKNKYFDGNMNPKSDMIGQIIDMDDILQMYVWIPRYRYKLWNGENGVSDEQMINIVFESPKRSKALGTKNGEYLTHPAFTFGDTELSGIWVGKFEMTGTTDFATIKPNSKSLINENISTMFNLSRTFSTTLASSYGLSSNEVDSHMIKNRDWGAVAYLTNSKYGRYLDSNTCIESGCTPWKNTINVSLDPESYQAFTGCSTSKSDDYAVIDNVSTCLANFDWKTGGVNASTTGNMYGIYDMNGGAWEMTMSLSKDKDGNINAPEVSGFNKNLDNVEAKYYDLYNYESDRLIYSTNYLLGDATTETMKSKSDGLNYQNAWFKNQAKYPYGETSFIYRGGDVYWEGATGIFCFSSGNGASEVWATSRNVITKS